MPDPPRRRDGLLPARSPALRLRSDGPAATGPYPCHHCAFCDFRALCDDRLEHEDHVVRVAGIYRDQVKRLFASGINTLTALAETLPGTSVPKMAASTFGGLRDQAGLQLDPAALGHPGVASPRRRAGPRLRRPSSGARPATSSSIWKGTRSSSRRAGSNTSSAFFCSTAPSRGTSHSGPTTARAKARRSRLSSISFMRGSIGIPICTSTTSAAPSRARSSGSWPSTRRARWRWTTSSGAGSSWICTPSFAGPCARACRATRSRISKRSSASRGRPP